MVSEAARHASDHGRFTESRGLQPNRGILPRKRSHLYEVPIDNGYMIRDT